jgi:hypothetical protein
MRLMSVRILTKKRIYRQGPIRRNRYDSRDPQKLSGLSTRGPWRQRWLPIEQERDRPAEDKRRRPLSAAGGRGYWGRGGELGVGDAEG